jgi:predicted lipoprotein with Yx(FWY)xxD motif
MKRLLTLAVAPAAIAVVAAGCGGTGNAGAAPASGAAKAAKPRAGGGAVALRTTKLGRVLVDGRGRALYLFEKDTSSASTCDGACASIWPPLTTTGKPRAGAGIVAAKLGTTTRKDGKTEVTYGGHPLYYYAADTKPGDVRGQGLDQFGAKWYVLGAGGRKIDTD